MIGWEFLSIFLLYGIPTLLAITLHEAAHGYVAYMRGDDTAYRFGRLSLNPLRHIDPMGTVLLPAFLIIVGAPFLFGFAKPVPVDFGRLKSPKKDMIWVALAGPLTNIGLAIVSSILIRFFYHVLPLSFFMEGQAGTFLIKSLLFSMHINTTLALFNMIPIPPLDGGRVLKGLLGSIGEDIFYTLEKYGLALVFALFFLLPSLLGTTFSFFFWPNQLLFHSIDYVEKTLFTPLMGPEFQK